jgi:hypothetical protein
MYPASTDDEILTHPAFPDVVAAYRLTNRLSYGILLPFMVLVLYVVFVNNGAFLALFPLSAVNVGAQMYGFRRARQAASLISNSETAQKRAQQLAYEAATPRLVKQIGRPLRYLRRMLP